MTLDYISHGPSQLTVVAGAIVHWSVRTCGGPDIHLPPPSHALDTPTSVSHHTLPFLSRHGKYLLIYGASEMEIIAVASCTP